MRTFSLLGLALMFAGCGPAVSESSVSSSQEKKQTSAAKAPAKQVKPQPKPELPPANFASVDEAVAALGDAAVRQNMDARIQAASWLVEQGPAAVGPLGGVLNDADAKLAARIAVSRVLGQLGPDAAPVLNAAISSDTQLIRLNAVEQLAVIKPVSNETIQTLIGLLDHEDLRMRQMAARGLGHIGKPASAAAPKLQSILDSDANETLRDAAKQALKKVNPRRTLVD